MSFFGLPSKKSSVRSGKSDLEKGPEAFDDKKMHSTPTIDAFGYSFPIKYVALLTLVIQNTSLVLAMKYSRSVGGAMYLASTAVLMGELVKIIICFFVLLQEKDFKGAVELLREELVEKRDETLKVSIPALLYTFQNNLLYLAVSNLDAATFQVSYQLKVLTTALFSVLLLGKQLNCTKWTSFVILMVGVALVQWPSESTQKVDSDGNVFVGITAVLTACVSSGFAGVYFEKVLKASVTSIWIRNIQMGLFSLLFGSVLTWWNDGEKLQEGGFFQGYNYLTWVVISLHAGGGLVVAVVVKYADNILKGFATSISIVLSTVLSIYFFNFNPTPQFLSGAALVIGSVYLYSKP